MTTWMTLCNCASVKCSGTMTRRQTGGIVEWSAQEPALAAKQVDLRPAN